MVCLPKGVLRSDEDEAAAKRRKLAEALRSGDDVLVSSTGTIQTTEDVKKAGGDESAYQKLPDGKLAQWRE